MTDEERIERGRVRSERLKLLLKKLSDRMETMTYDERAWAIKRLSKLADEMEEVLDT